MPQYFIDFRDKGGMARDEEGTEFVHLEDVLTEAKDSARDLVRQFMDTRTPLGETCVEVRDTKGRVGSRADSGRSPRTTSPSCVQEQLRRVATPWPSLAG